MKTTKGKWESVGVAVQDVKDPAFYHTDVLCNGTIRVAKSSGVGKSLTLGNASLIAAAPELLAACEWTAKGEHHRACKHHKNPMNCDCYVGAAKTALEAIN